MCSRIFRISAGAAAIEVECSAWRISVPDVSCCGAGKSYHAGMRFVVFVCLISSHLAFGQHAFEVASIKATDPNPNNAAFIGMSADGARVKYSNITLRDCIRGAFRTRDFQIVGPDWMTKA